MRIVLHGNCINHPGESKLADSEFKALNVPQFSKDVAACLVPHSSVWEATHRTARKRALRAERMGYVVRPFEPRDYHEDVLAINRSKAERQGRPMADHYVNRQRGGLIGPPLCPWHHRLEYGVFKDGHLYGYAGMIRCGDLLHVSMFLGHWDRLDDGIMYLLVREVLRAETKFGPCVLFYHRYDGGKDGLRFFKDRIGLKPMDVTWNY